MRKSKNNKNNTITTITPSTSDKTPIEIALQIDKDGMTTLSKLYDFLEINPSNYSRWCRKNIINTTSGIADSEQALTYTEPKKDNIE